MTTQSEAVLEENLVHQLGTLGYAQVVINDEASLLANLKSQLEAFNQNLYSAKEFGAICNHLAKGNIFAKAKTLRDRFLLLRDNGDKSYVRFFNSEQWNQNLFQVTHQVSI